MEKTKKKRNVVRALSLIGLFSAISLSAITGVVGAMAEIQIIDLPTKDFSAQSGGYTFDCFILSDHDTDATQRTISVAWGQDPETAINSELNIPDTFTNSATNRSYKVVAIANAGFRYCTFPSISIPATVTSIGSEAFAYCMNLTEITIPYHVNEIKPSTFLDCRSLTSVYYANEGSRTSKAVFNYNIATIGNHAFDSCVSLTAFNCPRSATYFGESCFQNCTSFTSFSFPRERKQGQNVLNYITVRPFAFADCTNLSRLYFETNMQYIHNYAFTDCADDLTIDYTGASLAAFDNFAPNWRRRYIATSRNNSLDSDGPDGHLIKVNLSQTAIREDDRYPGLHYQIVKTGAAVRLDVNTGYSTVTDIILIPANTEYAIIDGFTAPSVNKPGYYDIATGALTLPDQVVDPDDDSEENADKQYKVLAIARDAFLNHTELQSVSFNESLVQIRREAFFGCTNISSLDFMNCQKLREISHKAFQDCTALTAINLPYCLEYIGDYAFNRCYFVTQLTFSASDALFVKDATKGWILVSGTILRGTTAPSDDYGDNDNYYIDTIKYKAYKKTNNSWSLLANQKFGQVDPTGGNNGDYYVAIPRLKVIGERAFHRVGYIAFHGQDATVNLILPESLNDAAAVAAHYNHELAQKKQPSPQGDDWEVTGGRTNYREVAVGRHAFDRAICLATVEMAEAIDWDGAVDEGTDNDHKLNSGSLAYKCSIGTSAFARCYNLVRFQVSDNFYTIGASCFNAKPDTKSKGGVKYNNVDYEYSSFKLREVFLKSEKASLEGSIFLYPFGVGNHDVSTSTGDGLAVGGDQKDLVIYVKGGVPKSLGSNTTWNSENQSYPNKYEEKTSTRQCIPTYFNVDWQSADGLLYWKPGLANDNSNEQFASKPQSLADYKDNRISLVKQGDTYVVGRYYCNAGENNTNLVDYIDLSKVPSVDCTYPTTIEAGDISSGIETIGMSAFGAKADYSHGLYFVLPSSVKYIKERAFFCDAAAGTYGVRIVTCRNDSSKIYNKSGGTYSTDADFKAICTSAGNGYCYLPDGVVTIGRDAFYNNTFGRIRIGASLAVTVDDPIPFGTGAFSINANSYTTSISFGSTSLDMFVRSDSGTWVEVPYFEGTVATSNPASPTIGQMYYHSSNKKVYMYTNNSKDNTNTAWVELGGSNGDFFINTANGDLYKFTSSWAKITLSASNSGTSAPAAGTGNPGDYYYDTAAKKVYVKSNGSALYYDNTANSNAKKTLVYQAGNNTGLLKIEDNTVAIGKQAVARSKYNSVYIPSSVTTLYSSCFAYNQSLRSVVGGTGIQYINADQSPEIWSSSLPFDMIDDKTTSLSNALITGSTYNGAFSGCNKLMYIDFTNMAALKKIGVNAFNGCSRLSDMTGGHKYSYYKYRADMKLDTGTKDENRNDGVLDLTNCQYLTNIYGNAFAGCTSLKYIHTPTTSPKNQASKINIQANAFSGVGNAATYLVGETASQADPTIKNSDGGLNTGSHYYSNSFSNITNLYYRVDSAVITLTNNENVNDDYGRDGDFAIVMSGTSPNYTNTVYEKRSGEWVALTNSELVQNTGSSPSITGASDEYAVGKYWLNSDSHVLFKKTTSTTWQVVGDIPLDETFGKDNDGNDAYSGAVRSYWTYDSTNDRYILFPKGNTAQKLAKMYFYYGVIGMS